MSEDNLLEENMFPKSTFSSNSWLVYLSFEGEKKSESFFEFPFEESDREISFDKLVLSPEKLNVVGEVVVLVVVVTA